MCKNCKHQNTFLQIVFVEWRYVNLCYFFTNWIGTNISTEEEVAIKLVKQAKKNKSYWICTLNYMNIILLLYS